MVQVIDDERDVFAHIDADIVRSGEKLRCLVYQVGGQDAVDQTVLIVLSSNFCSPLVNRPKVAHTNTFLALRLFIRLLP